MTLRRWPVVAVVIGTVLLTTVLVIRSAGDLTSDVLVPTSWRSADTRALVRGADEALRCVREGTFVACGYQPPGIAVPEYPEVANSTVDRFSPLLYVPALLVQGVGGSQASSLRLLIVLSLLSFALAAGLPWIAGLRVPRLHRHRHLWAVVIIASPLLPYAGSTWGEVPSAFLVAAAVVAVAAEAPVWVVAPVALLAGLSKDTAPLFVLALAFAVGHTDRTGWAGVVPRSRAFVAGGVASILAVVVTCMTNIFRFGTLGNASYLSPTYRIHDVEAALGHLGALVAAPNGGVVFFWPATLVVIVIAVRAWRAVDRTGRLRLLATAAASGGALVSLALWWSPFGWHSWSPRLTLPFIPALTVAVLVVCPTVVRPGRGLIALLAFAVVAAVPQAGVMGRERVIAEFMTAPRDRCVTYDREELIVRCTLDRAWQQRPTLLQLGARGVGEPLGAAAAVGLLAAGMGLVALWRRELLDADAELCRATA